MTATMEKLAARSAGRIQLPDEARFG